ncbi:MAG: hypothetical protein QXQ46_11020 [Thermoplasmatales archaeon]
MDVMDYVDKKEVTTLTSDLIKIQSEKKTLPLVKKRYLISLLKSSIASE